MEKDVIAVVHDKVIEMVDLRGHPKTTKKIGLSKFEFDFKVDGMGEKMEPAGARIVFIAFASFPVVVQNDSILAFHSHGMQGRSLKNGAITQEITDTSKTYKLLGSEKFVRQKLSFVNLINFHPSSFQSGLLREQSSS